MKNVWVPIYSIALKRLCVLWIILDQNIVLSDNGNKSHGNKAGKKTGNNDAINVSRNGYDKSNDETCSENYTEEALMKWQVFFVLCIT